MTSQRQARRERNREDFIRATTVAVNESGYKVVQGASTPGACAGNTFKEHLEDEIRKAVRVHNRLVAQCEAMADNFEKGDAWGEQGVEHKRKAARGMIRGLCKALLIYENSYEKDNKPMLLKMEKEFINGE